MKNINDGEINDFVAMTEKRVSTILWLFPTHAVSTLNDIVFVMNMYEHELQYANYGTSK